jgi:CubicO group peptidase (beta-lactamase class C family)
MFRFHGLAIGVMACLAVSGGVFAQSGEGPLDVYEGRYEYVGDTTLLIAAGPHAERLYAVISGARYPLEPDRDDVFLNSGGQEVHFVRNRAGAVTGYRVLESQPLETNRLFHMLDSTERYPEAAWTGRPDGAPDTYAYRAPDTLDDGLATAELANGDPLRERVSALAQSVYDDEWPYLHSALVYRDGALVFEEYFYQYDRDTRHQMRSATKTLVALLVGAAIDRGAIASVDVEVLPYFDAYDALENVDDRKRAITLDDLLSMRSGLACDDWDPGSPGNEVLMGQSDDWVRFVLDLPMSRQPGSEAAYCSGNVILAGRMVEMAVGMPLVEFADEVLFAPLGITDYDWDFSPDRSNTDNFCQAWLRPRDMMKIGVMIANDGVFDGDRVLPADWIGRMTSAHSDIDGTPYGYFWWGRYLFADGVRHETPQASGNGGQKIIHLDALDTVIVLTAGNYNAASHTNDLLAQYLLAGLAGENP